MNEILVPFKNLPRFEDGRIDFSTSDVAPVVTVFVMHEGQILLLKRSDKVRTYQGLWNTVAGYIDEDRPVEEIVRKELREELGILDDIIADIRLGKPFEINDESISKSWIAYPALAVLKSKPEIRLDWEHCKFVWIKPEEIKKFETVHELEKSWEAVDDTD